MASIVRSSQIVRLLGPWQATRGPRGSHLPEYGALAATVRGLLRDGRLALGVRVPAERELAVALGVSRTTVTAAYRTLRESGHLTSRRGAGSWTALPEGQRIATSGTWAPADESDMLDLGIASLPAPAELIEAAREAVGELPAYALGSGYYPEGLPALREVVAARFTDRGAATRPDQIMITSGVQQAVDLLLRLAVAPGQPVLVESPTYPNVLAAMRAHRTRLSTVDVDPGAGWDGEATLAALRSTRPTLAYVIPDFQNPTGHLMPVDLRDRLASAARASGTDLLVDESFVDLPLGTDVPPPLASFDRHARVLTVGGMTKPYWGGLRVGWIRAAAPVIARLAAMRVAVDMAGPVLDQLVALQLLARADEVIIPRREQLTRRRDVLMAAVRERLPEWTFAVPGGGVCLWAELDAPVSTALARAALEHGVRLVPGPRFAADGTLERFVRLPFTLPEADLVEAVRRLVAATADVNRAEPAGLVA